MGRIGNAFDIMRLRGGVASVSGRLCWALALAVPSLGLLPAGALAAGGPDSTAGGRVEAGAETYWLPIPVEEIEEPEGLDDAPAGAYGFSMRATVREGVAALRRVAAARSGRSRIVELSLLGEGAAARAGTLAIRGTRSVPGTNRRRGNRPCLNPITIPIRPTRWFITCSATYRTRIRWS